VERDEVLEGNGMLRIADLVQDGTKVKIDLKPMCPKTLADARKDALMMLTAGDLVRQTMVTTGAITHRIDRLEDDVPEELRVPETGSDIVLFERVPRASAIWTTTGEPARLDHEGAEIVIVGVTDDPEHDLGVDVLAPTAAETGTAGDPG
jgi:hypothetical protein